MWHLKQFAPFTPQCVHCDLLTERKWFLALWIIFRLYQVSTVLIGLEQTEFYVHKCFASDFLPKPFDVFLICAYELFLIVIFRMRL